MKNLKNKVAVVTGVGSGIGKALAWQLGQEGCLLAINELNPERLETLTAELEESGTTVLPAQFDVADRPSWDEFADQVIRRFGRVDLVINNAGVALGKFTVEEVDYQDFEWLMNINFWGMVYGTKVFLPELKVQDEAALVNVSSVLGLAALAGQSPYCASKFAIRGFTESLRMEAAQEFPHVSIHSVHPGGIKTNIGKDANWENSKLDKGEQERLITKFETTFITTPEDAADQIIQAVKKKKSRVLIGSDARRFDRVARLFPTGYTKMVLKDFERKGF